MSNTVNLYDEMVKFIDTNHIRDGEAVLITINIPCKCRTDGYQYFTWEGNLYNNTTTQQIELHNTKAYRFGMNEHGSEDTITISGSPLTEEEEREYQEQKIRPVINSTDKIHFLELNKFLKEANQDESILRIPNLNQPYTEFTVDKRPLYLHSDIRISIQTLIQRKKTVTKFLENGRKAYDEAIEKAKNDTELVNVDGEKGPNIKNGVNVQQILKRLPPEIEKSIVENYLYPPKKGGSHSKRCRKRQKHYTEKKRRRKYRR
jgi:hypothetical protein